MLVGIWGCVIEAIGVVLKYFLPKSERIWPLYTLFILGGWTMYAPAQLLVLYSRLHLVKRNRRLKRWVLALIISVTTLLTVPTWFFGWQALNPYKSHLSAFYSPGEAIMDRVTQISYTCAETVVSGIYIQSLANLLKLKSSVRQRRVTRDLLYVNVIAVCLDVLTVILMFLNKEGISHPVQAFSYILKFKLEFVVLNQLVAVAARGVRLENFAERRYHHPTRPRGIGLPAIASNYPRADPSQGSSNGKSSDYAAQIRTPSPTLPSVHRNSDSKASQASFNHVNSGKWPTKTELKRSKDEEQEEEEDIGGYLSGDRGKSPMDLQWFSRRGDV
ncbi:hypothetical protein N7G274_009693 [Stereocaulon virgatum]|uniref:DUF7703 domain-containing protein n=1 Tax=Stereocaulon virgatum TaxID=373712 RepID=A0ABR3ZVD9_9LECA